MINLQFKYFSTLGMNILSILIFSVINLGGIILIYIDRQTWRFALHSLKWPSCRGKLTKVSVIESQSTGLGNDGTFAPRNSMTRDIKVEFSYRVNGVTYNNDRYDCDGFFVKTDFKARINMAVRVFYDPANPEFSTLRRGLTPGLLLGPICCLIGLVSVAVYI